MRVLLCTASSNEEAERISTELVESKLAACCNIVPGISSLYLWKGKLCKEQEVLIIVKCSAAKVEAVTKRIMALHSYDLPEIIAIPVDGGSKDYIDWVEGSHEES